MDTLKKHLQHKLNSESGAALVFSLIILGVLLIMTAGFCSAPINELHQAKRYLRTAKAFWLAEAGANRFIQNTALLNGGSQTIAFGNYSVSLSKDDTDPQKRIVTSTTTVDGVSKTVKIEFPANAPGVFDNTISSGGNITINGLVAGIDVNQKTRITGTYSKNGFLVGGTFDDKVEGVTNTNTTLKYPDADSNGTADQFADFKTFNQDVVASYDPSEVVYIQSDSTVNLYPSSALVGKKIVYIEGTSAGQGDANIWFDTTWAANQDLTVISTGSVNFIQPLSNPASNSQLNTISWDNYNEGAIFYSTHSGVTYTHGAANYGSIISFSDTDGSLISNGNIALSLIGVWKRFDWEDPLDEDGNVPAGFEGLVSNASGYSSTPASWEEI